MNYNQLKRKLKKAECFKTSEGKRHEKWMNPKNGHITFIGRHGNEEVPKGTLDSIFKDLFGQ